MVDERDGMKKQEIELKKKIMLLENYLAQFQQNEEELIEEEDNEYTEDVPTELPYQPSNTGSNRDNPQILQQQHMVFDKPPPTSSWPLDDQQNNAMIPFMTRSPLGDVPTAAKENISLSPLRFSDSSYTSGLQALNNAMKMVDEGMPLLNEPSSTPVKNIHKPKGKENSKPCPPLVVEGNHVSVNRINAKPNKKGVAYKAPPLLKQQQKPKIRNYNIKE